MVLDQQPAQDAEYDAADSRTGRQRWTATYFVRAGALGDGAGAVVVLATGLVFGEVRSEQTPTAASANDVHASASPRAAFANARSRGGPDSASAFNPFANTRFASIAFLQPSVFPQRDSSSRSAARQPLSWSPVPVHSFGSPERAAGHRRSQNGASFRSARHLVLEVREHERAPIGIVRSSWTPIGNSGTRLSVPE
jgi:hypothetical protein